MAQPYAEQHERLHTRRRNIERRLEAVRNDRRRRSDPLVQDWSDQAIQRENDETLDALDRRDRRELEAISVALERMEAGIYEQCVACQGPIETERLRVEPTTTRCRSCMVDEGPGH